MRGTHQAPRRPALIERVRETIARHAMLRPGDRVVVAVSGGPDSVALLAALHALRDDLGVALHVAHLDHMLRPGSEDDAAFAAALASRLDVPATIGRDDVRALARRERRSLEDAGRRARYAFLRRVAGAAGAGVVATGHTADDQAETVLMRLLRGAGPEGLAGIRPVRDDRGIRIIRPLLETSRADARAFLEAAGLAWRDDPTNRDPSILRNRVRASLLPILEGHNPGVTGALRRVAALLRDDDDALASLARAAYARVARADDGEATLDPGALAALPPALQRRVVRLALGAASGNPEAGSYVHVEAVRDLALRGRTGAEVALPGGLVARRTARAVSVGAGGARRAVAEATLRVPGATPAGHVAIEAALVEEIPDPLPGERAPDAYLDAALADAGLVVRAWRRGDRIVFRGGSRTVADVFGDEKVPRHLRRRVPLVATGETVVWVVGHRVAEPAKVRRGATRALRLRAVAQPERGAPVL